MFLEWWVPQNKHSINVSDYHCTKNKTKPSVITLLKFDEEIHLGEGIKSAITELGIFE